MTVGARSDNKSPAFILLAIASLGFVLRAYHLGRASLWFDEISTFCRATDPILKTVRGLFHSAFPPLYYMMMNSYVKAFGETRELALRMPSLVFSVLSIFLIFKLSKRLFDEKTAVIAALLLSLSPCSIYWAQEAKMYAMLWFLGLCSFYFFHKFTEDGRAADLFWYVIFTTLSVYTLYVGFIFIIIQNAIFFLAFDRKRLKGWLLGQSLVILLYLPWIDKFLYNAIHQSGIKWIPRTTDYFLYLRDLFLLVTGLSIGSPAAANSLLGIAEAWLCLLLIIPALRSDLTRGALFIFSWIVTPVIIYLLIDIFVYPILMLRYAALIHIPLIILFARVLAGFSAKARTTVLALLIFMICLNSLYPYYKNGQKLDGQDFRELTAQIERRAGKNDLVVVIYPVFPACIQYYRKGDINVRFVWSEKIKEIEKACKGYSRVFVVYSARKPALKAFAGYALEEEYAIGKEGFLKFYSKNDNVTYYGRF